MLNCCTAQTPTKVGTFENGKLTLLLSDVQLTEIFGKNSNNLVFSNSQLVQMKDEAGNSFFAVQSQGKREGQNVSVVLVLTQSGSDLTGGTSEGCEMDCISTIGCESCTQVIIVPCKSQKCTCSGGGCSSKIKFYTNTPKN